MTDLAPGGDRLVLVMRHGEAGRAARDFDRELNEAGRSEVRRHCELLGGRIQPTHIIASPLVRARQTAEIARQTLGIQGDIATWNELEPDGDCERAARRLAEESGTPLLVGHQPFVALFIEYLTGTPVRLATGAVAAIRCEVVACACGSLEWHIHV